MISPGESIAVSQIGGVVSKESHPLDYILRSWKKTVRRSKLMSDTLVKIMKDRQLEEKDNEGHNNPLL